MLQLMLDDPDVGSIGRAVAYDLGQG